MCKYFRVLEPFKVTPRFTLTPDSVFKILPYRGPYPDIYSGDVEVIAGSLSYNGSFGEFYDFVNGRYNVIPHTSKLNENWGKVSDSYDLLNWNEYLSNFNSNINTLINSSAISVDILKCKLIQQITESEIWDMKLDKAIEHLQMLKEKKKTNMVNITIRG